MVERFDLYFELKKLKHGLAKNVKNKLSQPLYDRAIR